MKASCLRTMDGLRRKDDVVLRFDLPGIDPQSIEVTVDRGVLTVSATREEAYEDDERLFVRERVMGTFSRRVHLSEHLDAEQTRWGWAPFCAPTPPS
jgi:HSP20 family protein